MKLQVNEMENNCMNILMLNYEYPPVGGGGSAVCRDLAEELVQRGSKVTVVTMNMKGLAVYETVNGVFIYRVKCLRKSARVCEPWEQMTYCVSAYRFINRNLDVDSFDAIHCHFIIPTGLLALWIKKKYGKEYLLTAHGSDVLGHNMARFALLYKIVKPLWISILKNAKGVTAPSTYLVNKIKESYPKAECKMITNAIHLKDYYSGKKKKIIITLCRLQESKGVQDLIEAASDIELGEWKIYIFGEGPYKEQLAAMVRQYSLQDKVVFKGYVQGRDKYRYLSEAGLYFTGSRFEACGISTIEAMASGCEVVVSDIEAHRGIVPRESRYTSTEDLKIKIKKILSVTPESKKYDLGANDWNVVVKQFERLYK